MMMTMYSETLVCQSQMYHFPDPLFNFCGPWTNPISTMAPTPTVSLYPSLFSRTLMKTMNRGFTVDKKM
jgi:hypothetical protein